MAPAHLSDRIGTHFDINGYDTRRKSSMELYHPSPTYPALPMLRGEAGRSILCMYMVGKKN